MKAYRWLFDIIKVAKPQIIQSIFLNICINFIQIFTSLFVMVVYNKIIPNSAISSLITLVVGIGLVLLFDLIFKVFKARIIDEAARVIDEEIQPALYKKILNWDLENKPKTAGSSSSLIRDLDSVVELFTNNTVSVLIGIPFIFINIFVIYLIAGNLAFVCAAIVLLAMLISIVYYIKVLRVSEEAKEANIDKNTVFLETVNNLETLKSIGSYDFFEKKWEVAEQHCRRTGSLLKNALADANSFNSSLSSVAQIAIVATGALLVIETEITAGALIAAVILNGRTIQPVLQLAGFFQKFSVAKIGLDRLTQVFSQSSKEELRRQNLHLKQLEGPLRVNDLSFQPEGLNTPILEIEKVTINQNDRIGIIGPVGSGKSTFLKLLAGVYSPTEGTVSYGSFDTTAINQGDLRRDVAYLGQSPNLFGGTIRDNLVFGDDSISDESIIQAMALTGFDTILRKFPNGLSFRLSEGGTELSGGQKQILSLTRAMISNPSFILLDEPTSAMDPRHEILFINQMKSFIGTKTFLVVTHRKPILALTNRVMLIDNGKIVMDGNRDEVLKKFK